MILLSPDGHGTHPSSVTSHTHLCFIISLCQIVLALLFYLAHRPDSGYFSPILNHLDFSAKLLCCFLLHLVIGFDLQKSIEVMSYLRHPTSPGHIVRGHRCLASVVEQSRYMTAVFLELIHILVQASVMESVDKQDGNHKSQVGQILLNFITLLILYEIPTFIYRLKMGKDLQKEVLKLYASDEMHHTDIEYDVRDQNSPNQELHHRNSDIDCWLSLFYPLFSFFHRVVYVYAFYLGIIIVEVFFV